MTIRPGQQWGEPVVRQPALREAASDRQLVALAERDDATPLTVLGGDLYRTLGSPARRTAMTRVPLDLIEVELDDGSTYRAVAHVRLFNSMWRGRVLAACNVAHMGSWTIAPRAHPNDGLVDIVDIAPSMSLRQRWQLMSRLAHGTHLPHPDIVYERVTEAAWSFGRPVDCHVDSTVVGTTQSAKIRIVPDALRLDY